MPSDTPFVCGCCGESFDSWPPDIGFQRPDAVLDLPSEEREGRAWESNDLCVIDDERFFVRGVFYVPLQSHDARWGIGLWAEVAQADFEHYLRHYDKDASDEAPFEGKVANQLDAFGGILGQALLVHLGNATQRPHFTAAPTNGVSTSALAMAQISGLDDASLHEIINRVAKA